MIEINPSNPAPLYLQIAEQLRRLIALGLLKPGERLPTVRELAGQTRVNRNTAARAIQRLESEGLVRTRVGQGTFVQTQGGSTDREAGEGAVDELLDELLVQAQTLGVPQEELSWRLSRRIELFRKRRAEAAAGSSAV